MKGRRLPDTRHGDLPDDVQPGDYWRDLVRETGEPMVSTIEGNLTGGCWTVCAPTGDMGMLRAHTVREEDDGTISVRPGDGSSNSILITTRRNGEDVQLWHGYIERGEWREA